MSSRQAASWDKDPILGGATVALAPVVIVENPANGALGVAVGIPGVSATFNEPVAALTGGAGFTLTCAAPCTNPAGTVALNGTGRIATYTLASGTRLAPFTLYTATITGARSIASGLVIAAPHTWTFTTGATPDTTRPLVTYTAPATSTPAPLGVPVNAAIVAAFTEGMNAATITAAGTFTVTCTAPCTSPTGVVSYVSGSRTAVFTPSTLLTAATPYTARITMAATDLAGNALAGNQAAQPAASDYVWTFTTGAASDTTRPGVSSTAPVTSTPAPVNVPTNSAIVAVFTENMSPATITAPGTVTVTCTAPCVSPVGVVTYAASSRTAVFTPNAALGPTTTYTATISTAAMDLGGNALAGNQAAAPAASNYVWTFTTTAAVPAANLSVLSTSPTANAVGTCPSGTVNATFNVPSGLRMDPATISAATFRLTGPAPASIPVTPASVTLDVATGRVATFTPQTPLTNGVAYTATITGGSAGVKDLAVPGNAMVSDTSWSFTAGPRDGKLPDAANPGNGRALRHLRWQRRHDQHGNPDRDQRRHRHHRHGQFIDHRFPRHGGRHLPRNPR